MKLSLPSGLLLTLISWHSVLSATSTIVKDEPFCSSDSEDLEVYEYLSYVRTQGKKHVQTQTISQENDSRKLEDCNPPESSKKGEISYAFIVSYDGDESICAVGVADLGSTSAAVEMPNSEIVTFNLGCSDHYKSGYSDSGVDITPESSYRVLYYQIVEFSSGSLFNWRRLATSKSCNPCQFGDSYYQNFCKGGPSTTKAAPEKKPPTKSPVTPPPTIAPVTPPPTQSPMSITSSFVDQARSDIELLILSDPILAPKFVRMIFHDCVGGCDGCIDLTNPDNNGLDIPIDALDSIVKRYTVDLETGLTRPDIWALAALTAADVSQAPSQRVDYEFNRVGRKACEVVQSVCFDSKEQEQSCTARGGPHRAMPSASLTTSELDNFFNINFGFSPEQWTALMGAHSLGQAHREKSGFNGAWVSQNLVLSNSYYQNLVGGSNGSSDSEETMVNAPVVWNNTLTDNSDLTDIPNRWQWESSGLIMLDTDIALVRDFSELIDVSTGHVTCPFASSATEGQACPFASLTGSFVAQYKSDEMLFLKDFRDVFTAMLVNGYDATGTCDGPICQLS